MKKQPIAYERPREGESKEDFLARYSKKMAASVVDEAFEHAQALRKERGQSPLPEK